MNIPFTNRPDRPLRAEPEVPRRINLVVIMVAIVIVLVAVSLPSILNASTTISTVKHGTDLTGCRSLFAAAVTDANTDLSLASAHGAVLQDQFLVAIGTTSDPTQFAPLFQQLDAAQQQIVSAAEKVGTANEKYQNAVLLSNSDPDKFVAGCKKMPKAPDPTTSTTVKPPT